MSCRLRCRGESSFQCLQLLGFDGCPRTSSLAGHGCRIIIHSRHRRTAGRVFRRRVVVLLVLGGVLGFHAAVGIVVDSFVLDWAADGRRETDAAAGRQSTAAGT